MLDIGPLIKAPRCDELKYNVISQLDEAQERKKKFFLELKG